jgi:hypothetical protein
MEASFKYFIDEMSQNGRICVGKETNWKQFAKKQNNKKKKRKKKVETNWNKLIGQQICHFHIYV